VEKEIQNIVDKLVNLFEDEYFWYELVIDDKKEVFYTDNVVKVTGYTSDELLAMPGKGKDIIYTEDLQKLKQKVNEFKNDKQNNFINLEFRIVHKDENIVWVNETIIVDRNENGEVTASFGKVSNISAYKISELNLKKELDEMRKISASKDNFIAMLSHDLRAPFTSILGFSEILLNETNLPEKEKAEYLSYINDSSQNQLQLINDLLDWSRLQTDKLKIEHNRVHAQSMVFNCVSSLTGNAVRKNIDIKVDVPENLYVNADERLLTQVITNLLSNAIKFSPEGTTVEISANIYNEKLSEFIIKDEGIGITEENKEKLFKIGRMFSTEGTKGEKGTGLGLALARQIVEKHNGEIWFYSTPTEGSEFHFTIPSSANTILIVKNNKEIRESHIDFLKERFPLYQVIGAGNGYEALGIILRHMPSLIISDPEMPLMNGLQLIHSIRGEDKPLNIPVIAVLQTESDELIKAYEQYGIKTIKDDPFNLNQLDEQLRSVFK
jgi:signal transduction histidine kinase/CheY-like chemotaxis protein